MMVDYEPIQELRDSILEILAIVEYYEKRLKKLETLEAVEKLLEASDGF